jgi:hypothetical protein
MMRLNVFCCAAVALSLGAASVTPSALVAQTNAQKTPQPAGKVQPLPRSVIQKLRAFLGVNPPVAVGGSRSGTGQSICLLSPWPSPDREGTSIPVSVLVSRPTILAAGPLNEFRIEKDNRILKDDRASLTEAIEGPIAWPIRPLQPGEQITLKLRPRGASGGDFATFSLRAADAQVLAENDRKAQALGDDPKARERFLAQLEPQQAGLAAAVLSGPQVSAEQRESLQCSAR